MSHARILVLAQDKEEIERLLEPYDENIAVIPYERDCYCVGEKAFAAASKKMKSWRFEPDDPELKAVEERYDARKLVAASLVGIRVAIPRISDEEHSIVNRYLREKEIAWDKAYNAAVESHPERHSPNPDCQGCNGTGRIMSTYNPEAKWDYYTILSTIQVPSPEAAADSVFAVVTEDGKWHESAELGWFGLRYNHNEEWERELGEILAAHAGQTATVVDIHI